MNCVEEENFPFAEIAKRFVLIEDSTCPVLIPKEEKAAEIADALRSGYISRSLLRQAGKYCVNVRYGKEFAPLETMLRNGKIEMLGETGTFYVLSDMALYDSLIGLMDNIEEGEAIIY